MDCVELCVLVDVVILCQFNEQMNHLFDLADRRGAYEIAAFLNSAEIKLHSE